MRREFLAGLLELAEIDDRVFLVTADLGFGAIEPFADAFPDRFLNIGVAEQAMVSVSTGLAREGFHPYCYSIATFAVARTWEFLRNGPIAHRLPMGIIGVGPGFDYGADGHTHHALEDVGLVRLLPDARIVCPSDAVSARDFGRKGLESGTLTYFRLARNGPDCQIPVLNSLHEDGTRRPCVVVALGDMWARAEALADRVSASGLPCAAYVVEELGLAESEERLRLLANFERVIVVEGHMKRGGLSAAVSEQLAQVAWPGQLLPVGVIDLPTGRVGSAEFLWKEHTMGTEDIVEWAVSEAQTWNP